MNTDVNVLDKNPVSTPVSGSTVALQGPLGKEKAPLGTNLSEFIAPAGPEINPNLPPGVSEHVEIKSDRPDLTSEHKELGIDYAGPHVPVSTSSSSNPSSLMTEEEIKKFKTGDATDSKTGLAIILDKLKKMIGL